MNNLIKPIFLLSLLAIHAAVHGQITNGLIGRWTFDGNLTDSSGKGNHGTHYLKTFNYTAGKSGNPNTAAVFDSNGVQIAYNPGLHLSQFSIYMVVRFNAFDTSKNQYTQMLLAKNTGFSMGLPGNGGFTFALSDVASDSTYQIKDTSTLALIAGVGNNYSYYAGYAGSTPLHSGQWYCVTYVYDSFSYKMYIDGVLTKTVQGPNPSPVDSVANPIYIGVSPSTLYLSPTMPAHFLDGVVDEVQLFNRALSAQEVTSLCGNPVTINEVSDCGIRMYPNPAQQQVMLEGKTSSKHISAEIYDLAGRVVTRSLASDSSGRYKLVIDVQRIPPGIYVVELDDGTSIKRERLLIEH